MQTVQNTYGSEHRASSRSTTVRISSAIDDHRAPATTDPTSYVAGIMETHRQSTDEIHGLSTPMPIISFIWNVDVEFSVHISRNKAISASNVYYRAFDSCCDPSLPKTPTFFHHDIYHPLLTWSLSIPLCYYWIQRTLLVFFLFSCASIAIRGLSNRLLP